MSLFKRANSKFWWYKFTFDGERIQASSKTTNKKKAQLAETRHYERLLNGELGVKEKKEAPTFEKAADEFLAWAKVERTNAGTYKRYKYAVKLLKKYFAKTRTDRIEKKDIEKFIAWRRVQKSQKTRDAVETVTINLELLVLKMIFNRLVSAEVLRDSPARPVKRLAENDPEFHVITPSEEKIYLLACPQPLQDVASLMLQTGARCGELYNLRRQDVFLDKGFLKIAKGKTKSARRNVYLTEKAKEILRYRMNKFKGVFLFPQDDIDGKPPTRSLDRLHAAVVETTGLQFRLYDCRHTFATRAVEIAKIDLVTLASILGHSSLRMVMRYAHPSELHKENAIRAMEGLSPQPVAKAS